MFLIWTETLLRTIMEDLTYMYCPGDDLNKERVILQLEPDDDDDDDDDEDMPPNITDGTTVSDIED